MLYSGKVDTMTVLMAIVVVFCLILILGIKTRFQGLAVFCIGLFAIYFAIFVSDVLLFSQKGRALLSFHEYIICLVNPPEDYFHPLARCSLSKSKQEYQLEFCNKYYGAYTISLELPVTNIVIGKNITLNLETESTYLVDHQKIRREFSNLKHQSWGETQISVKCSGYSVPRQLPVGKKITVNIRLKGDVNSFLEEYPKAYFSVQKISDE